MCVIVKVLYTITIKSKKKQVSPVGDGLLFLFLKSNSKGRIKMPGLWDRRLLGRDIEITEKRKCGMY